MLTGVLAEDEPLASFALAEPEATGVEAEPGFATADAVGAASREAAELTAPVADFAPDDIRQTNTTIQRRFLYSLDVLALAQQ